MDSPFPTLAMVVVYLLTVVIIGPSIMANRKPFQLNKILVYYNAFQVVYSAIMFYEVSVRLNVTGGDSHRSNVFLFL